MTRPSSAMLTDADTRDEIARILRFPFCTNVGRPLAGPFTLVRSWAEAEQRNVSSHWERIENAGRNRLTVRAAAAGAPFDRALLTEIRRALSPAEQTLCAHVAANTQSISWPAAILGLLQSAVLEFHLRREVSPFFFHRVVLPVFEAGHIPCGWTGKRIPIATERGEFEVLPEGRLIVF